MMTEKKRKQLYLLFKVSSVLVSCLLPIWAVCEKFPIWTMNYGTGRSIGVGAILILIVLAIVFRKTVFDYLSDRAKLKHAPPIFVWLVMLIVSYILLFIGSFLRDLVTVLWMGVIGCAMGTVLTFIGENFFGNKENKDNGCGS
jgi:hypothetical protein